MKVKHKRSDVIQTQERNEYLLAKWSALIDGVESLETSIIIESQEKMPAMKMNIESTYDSYYSYSSGKSDYFTKLNYDSAKIGWFVMNPIGKIELVQFDISSLMREIDTFVNCSEPEQLEFDFMKK